MNSAWLFVLAAILAALGILAAFKNLLRQVQQKIEAGEEVSMPSLQKLQTQFFIKVALAESVPLILIVFGFMSMDSVGEFNPIVPFLVILAVLIFALVQVFNSRREALGYDQTSKENQTMVNTLCFIGVAMIAAIPIISIIALMIMS